jgi:hypothetical protein
MNARKKLKKFLRKRRLENNGKGVPAALPADNKKDEYVFLFSNVADYIRHLKECVINTVIPKLVDHRTSKNSVYSLEDVICIAMDMAFCQPGSVLSYMNGLKESELMKICPPVLLEDVNLDNFPSIVQIRNILDGLDLNAFSTAHYQIFDDLKTSKILEKYRGLDGRFTLGVDGSGLSSSYNSHCEQCLTKVSKKTEKIRYEHYVLIVYLISPPDKKLPAIPLFPVFAKKTDNAGEKQDCETKMFLRWLEENAEQVKKLFGTELNLLGDDIYAHEPIIKKVGIDYHFYFTCKPSSHKALAKYLEVHSSEINELEIREELGKGKRDKINKTRIFKFRWICNVPIKANGQNHKKDGLDEHNYNGVQRVNYISVDICTVNDKGEILNDKYNRSTKTGRAYVTNDVPTKDNIASLINLAKSRWELENLGFNNIKTKGDNLDRVFMHGHKGLLNFYGALVTFGFTADIASKLLIPEYAKALEESKAKLNIRFTSRQIMEGLLRFVKILQQNSPHFISNFIRYYLSKDQDLLEKIIKEQSPDVLANTMKKDPDLILSTTLLADIDDQADLIIEMIRRRPEILDKIINKKPDAFDSILENPLIRDKISEINKNKNLDSSPKDLSESFNPPIFYDGVRGAPTTFSLRDKRSVDCRSRWKLLEEQLEYGIFSSLLPEKKLLANCLTVDTANFFLIRGHSIQNHESGQTGKGGNNQRTYTHPVGPSDHPP